MTAPTADELIMKPTPFEVAVLERYGPVTIFSISSYENLAINLQEIKRFIMQQNEMIKYYENCTQEGAD